MKKRKRKAERAEEASEYIFAFEVLRQYPTVRSFIIKQPLKKAFGEGLMELFGGKKK